MKGTVHFYVSDGVGAVVFDRPAARNAMTWPMYDALASICERIVADPSIRVVTLRGAGGEAFIAGTDIVQFRAFSGSADGIEYEKTVDARVAQVEALPVPTIAVIDGWTMGGGLALASACDFRIATPAARFGVPIARTLGNCLSMANTARIVTAFGASRAKRLLMLADTLDADEALACGFLTDIADPLSIDDRTRALCNKLKRNAPITMRVSKEAIRRLQTADLPHDEDLIREAYGSRDFKIGVEAFISKEVPAWTGE
jgi:enoyl-CoA hydratase